MKNLRVASCLLVLLVVNACASVQTTGRRSFDGDQNFAKPMRIIVYDFAATADDVAASSAITGRYKRRSTPQTANEIRLGRDLGHRVALELVKDILAMGLQLPHALHELRVARRCAHASRGLPRCVGEDDK